MNWNVLKLEAKEHNKANVQSLLALVISTLVHLGAALTLALILVATQGKGNRSVFFSVASQDPPQEIELLDLVTQQPTAEVFPEEMSVDLQSQIPDVDLESASSPSNAESLESAAMSSGIGLPLASASKSASPSLEDGTSKSRASFFGAEAEGNRFVFVIDSSKSMQGSRWSTLAIELVRAIQSLSPDQEFFVISFDSLAHPMFGLDPPKGKFLHPTPRNATRLKNWIRTIQLGHNTFPSGAIGIAMQLKPDAIFLLSDGEIRDNTLEDLRDWNRTQGQDGYPTTRVPIHTVLLHSQAGYATLEQIALENSGTFTPVAER
jgi:hypothetical protein